MKPYRRAELWGQIKLVAKAIADRSQAQHLETVRNRQIYLGTLLDQLEDRSSCTECEEHKGRLHHPTCGKRAEGAEYVISDDC